MPSCLDRIRKRVPAEHVEWTVTIYMLYVYITCCTPKWTSPKFPSYRILFYRMPSYAALPYRAYRQRTRSVNNVLHIMPKCLGEFAFFSNSFSTHRLHWAPAKKPAATHWCQWLREVHLPCFGAGAGRHWRAMGDSRWAAWIGWVAWLGWLGRGHSSRVDRQRQRARI